MRYPVSIYSLNPAAIYKESCGMEFAKGVDTSLQGGLKAPFGDLLLNLTSTNHVGR